MIQIFYLEDEVELCEMVREAFTQADVQFHCFPTADDFVVAVQQKKPDVVIIDFRLSETTGIEVANQLKTDIPKVLVTGELMLPEHEGLFDGVVTKPFRLSELKATIMSLVSS